MSKWWCCIWTWNLLVTSPVSLPLHHHGSFFICSCVLCQRLDNDKGAGKSWRKLHTCLELRTFWLQGMYLNHDTTMPLTSSVLLCNLVWNVRGSYKLAVEKGMEKLKKTPCWIWTQNLLFPKSVPQPVHHHGTQNVCTFVQSSLKC